MSTTHNTPGRILALQLRRDLHVARALARRSGKSTLVPELEECFDALPESDRDWANVTFEREHRCPGLERCPLAQSIAPASKLAPLGCSAMVVVALLSFLASAAYAACR